MKILIVSPQCCGSHWVSRSLSKSLKIPYCYYHEDLHAWPESKKEAIIVAHQKFDYQLFEKMKKDNVKVIGLTRNPLDHLISYCNFHGYPINDIEKIASSNDFLYQREISKSIPSEIKVSYEGLVNNTEIIKLEKILEIKKISLESKEETKKALPQIVRFAKVGYWNNFISNKKAQKICEIIQEEFL